MAWIGIIFVGFIVLGVIVVVALRSWMLDEARIEERLRSPDVHTVAYVVPEGQDVAVLMAAVKRAGFESITKIDGGTERLLVACDEEDRARVRSILEHVHRISFDGSEMYLDHVSFDDER
jgi:hypothetical protein